MSVIEGSIPAVLRERAHLQPSDTAFTFIDYQLDPSGHAESLTWSQVYRRALNVAHEVERCGSPGDRAVVLAPQGLDYVAAFLGALEAGLVAVPLSVPLGVDDEHVHAVLRDSLPAVVLTTSSTADVVTQYLPSAWRRIRSVSRRDRFSGRGLASRFRLDASSRADDRLSAVHLGFDASPDRGHGLAAEPSDQFRAGDVCVFFRLRKGRPTGHHRCLMGPAFAQHGSVHRTVRPDSRGTSHRVHESDVVHTTARSVDAVAGQQLSVVLPGAQLRVGVGGAGDVGRGHGRLHDLGDVMAIILGGERIQAATVQRFTQRFARIGLRALGDETVIRTGRGDGLRRDPRVGSPAGNRALRTGEAVFRSGRAVHERGRHSAGQLRGAAVTGP